LRAYIFCGACGNNRTNRGGFQFAAARLPWFFDDWPAVEEKLKVMLSGNELTPEQEALKTALENDD
ncbi:hypothetical protein, partial [Escherichia coli]|uniref:hypothetical protein n=1 Tax=Escherichia coli TaxID=562 RepID=UPI00254C93F1